MKQVFFFIKEDGTIVATRPCLDEPIRKRLEKNFRLPIGMAEIEYLPAANNGDVPKVVATPTGYVIEYTTQGEEDDSEGKDATDSE